jgi:GMP synthase (glutamine-hydrolysing)
MAKTAVAIRHVAFEDLGLLEPLLGVRGFAIRYLEAGIDDLSPAESADLVVVLGGPIGAYEEAIYPFLTPELALIERRLKADRPLLGVCLGAQLMARVLGARVYPGTRGKEIGWSPLELTEAGAQSALRHLAPELTSVLHWHGDTFDLPTGATRLAGSRLYQNQAFRHGMRSLALQFHAEATEGLERWLIGHAAEIASTPNLTVPSLRAATERHVATMREQGRRCFEEWLDELGL